VPDFCRRNESTKLAYRELLVFPALEKWLPPMAVVFSVTLVVITMLLARHKVHVWVERPDHVDKRIWGTYIADNIVPFSGRRIQYDVSLSMAPIIMMFMVPEPRLRSKYY
jgi:hypothetical protein